MRIISITAGAGGMYCGSCIRDNTLAKSLRAVSGTRCCSCPLYTPPRTDEPSVSEHRVFFGGISVYLEQYSRPLSRHTLADRPFVGGAVAAARGVAARRADATGATGRVDRVGARGSARPSAEGVRQARPLAALRAAAGRDRHLQLHADLAGPRAQGSDRLRHLLHAAGGGHLPGPSRRAVPLPSAGADPGARPVGRPVRRGQRLLRRPHGAVPAHSRGEAGRRPARRQRRRLSAGDAGRIQSVHDRLPRTHRAGEGDPSDLRRLPPPARAGRLWRAAGWSWPAISVRSTARTWTG